MIVPRPEKQPELQITKAAMPGNFRVVETNNVNKLVGAFSLNLPTEESQLIRLSPEPIEALFGPGSVLPLDGKTSLPAALQDHWKQPVELLPRLIVLVVILFALENLLANKFYRREPDEQETPQD
jgi:hypothetical protein